MEKCEVKDLSHETIENLTHSLEKPTLNWEELMRSKTFGSIYSANDIYKIGMSGSHRATVLIQDLVSREISLQVLLNGLKEIGNRKAISIIERGRWLLSQKSKRYGNGCFRIVIETDCLF